MFARLLLTAAAAFSSLAAAQNYSTSNGQLTITPSSVPLDMRESWCTGQLANCPKVCGGVANPNTCNPDTLQYQCVCANGNMPNITSYANMLPSFICAVWVGDCVDAHPNDLAGITACRSVTCGMKNASDVAASGSGSSSSAGAASASASSTASSATGSASSMTTAASKTGSATTSSSTAKSTGNAAVMQVGVTYGTGILSAGLLALFGLAL